MTKAKLCKIFKEVYSAPRAKGLLVTCIVDKSPVPVSVWPKGFKAFDNTIFISAPGRRHYVQSC